MVLAAARMTQDATIARLVFGMVWASRVVPLGCCGNYPKTIRDLDEVEGAVPYRIYHIEAFA